MLLSVKIPLVIFVAHMCLLNPAADPPGRELHFCLLADILAVIGNDIRKMTLLHLTYKT